MSNIWYAYTSWPDTQKNTGVPNCHSNRKSAILIQSSHFIPTLIHFPCLVLTNSSYRLNTIHFQFTQYHPQTFNMKSCQKLSPTWDMVGVTVPSIFMHCHEGLTPYNFQIQFPMFVVFHILHFSVLLRIFFSEWWWKVYDRKPQMRIPLSKLWKTHVEIQQLVLFMAGFTMLSDISPTARENTACDMDEVLWPDRNRRQDATCNCSKCNTEQKKKA